MAIKDKAVAWFVKNFIMPRSQIIDNPGFIIFKVSYKTDIYSRQTLIPESLLVSLEKDISRLHGNIGNQALYSVGKKFGYRFSNVSNLLNINELSKNKFLENTNIVVKFIEGTYASSISYNIDLDNLEIDFKLENFVICRKSGMGYIFTQGGSAGIWAYLIGDPTIEAVQPRCQGRGDKECEIICAPEKILEKKGYNFLKETDLNNLEVEKEYRNMNKIMQTEHAKISLKNLIDSDIFNFERGIISHNNERYFIVEASLTYLLEKELQKLENGEKILFDTSFNWGKCLVKGERKQDPCKFITDFMSAFGWGDIMAVEQHGKYNVYVKYFPWTRFYKDMKFIVFRGMISGIISGFVDKDIIFKNFYSDISKGYVDLVISE